MIRAAPWIRAPWTAASPSGPQPRITASDSGSIAHHGHGRGKADHPDVVEHRELDRGDAGDQGHAVVFVVTMISAQPPLKPVTFVPSRISAKGSFARPPPPPIRQCRRGREGSCNRSRIAPGPRQSRGRRPERNRPSNPLR